MPVITHIESIGCYTVPHFAAWIDELNVTESIKEEFLKRAPSPHRSDRGCVAKLKCAWQVASAGTKIKLDRSAKGLHDENYDEPLPPAVLESLEDSLRRKHDWKLKPYERVSDSQLARFAR